MEVLAEAGWVGWAQIVVAVGGLVWALVAAVLLGLRWKVPPVVATAPLFLHGLLLAVAGLVAAPSALGGDGGAATRGHSLMFSPVICTPASANAVGT